MMHSNTGILLEERLDSNCENEEENDFTEKNVPNIFNQTSQVIGNLECQKEDLVNQLNKPGHDHALDKFMLTHLKKQPEPKKRNKKVQNVTPLLYLPSEKNPSVVTIDQVMFNSLTGIKKNRNKRKRSEKSQNSSQLRRKLVIEETNPHFMNSHVTSPNHEAVLKEVEIMGDNPRSEEMVECAVCKVKLENNVRLALHSKVHRRHINTGMRRCGNDIMGGNQRKTLNDARLMSKLFVGNNTFSGVGGKLVSKSSGLNGTDEPNTLKNGNRQPEMTSLNPLTLSTGVNSSNLNFEQLSGIIRALAIQNVNIVSTIVTKTASEIIDVNRPVNDISVNNHHVKGSNVGKTNVNTLSSNSVGRNELGKNDMSNNEDDFETDISDCIPLSNSVAEPVNMQGRQLTINKTNTLLCLNSKQNLSMSPAKENVNSIYVAESMTQRDCMFKGPDSQNQSDDQSLETTDLSSLRNSETCLKRDVTMLPKAVISSKELDRKSTVNLAPSRQELERNALMVLTKLSQQKSPCKGNNSCSSSNPYSKLKRTHVRSNPEAQQSSDKLFKDSEYRGTTLSDCNDSLDQKSGLRNCDTWLSTMKFSKMPTNISPCTTMVQFVKQIENLCNVRKFPQENETNLHIDKHLNAQDVNEPMARVHEETQPSSTHSHLFEDDLLLNTTKYCGITLNVFDKFCSRTTCHDENMRNYRQWKRQFTGVTKSNKATFLKMQSHNLDVDSCNTNNSDYCDSYTNSVMDENITVNSDRSVNQMYETDNHLNVLNCEHMESCLGNTNIETSEHEMTGIGNIDEDENSSQQETDESAKQSQEVTQNAINMDGECFMKYRASASVLDDDSLIQCEKYRKLPLEHDDTVSSLEVSDNIEHSSSTSIPQVKYCNVHDQESTVEAVKHIESIQLNDFTGHSEGVGIQIYPTGNDIKGDNQRQEFKKGDNKSSVVKNLFNQYSRSFNTLDCTRSETNVYGQIMKSRQGETINNCLDDTSSGDETDPSNMGSKSNESKKYNEKGINEVSGKCSRVCSIQENIERIKCQKNVLEKRTNVKISEPKTGILLDNNMDTNWDNGEREDFTKETAMNIKHEKIKKETRKRKRQLNSKCSQNIRKEKDNVEKYSDAGECKTMLTIKEWNRNVEESDVEFYRVKRGTSNKQVHVEQIVNIGRRSSPRKQPITKACQDTLESDFIRRSPRKQTVNKSSCNSQKSQHTRRSPRKHECISKQSCSITSRKCQIAGKEESPSNCVQSLEKMLPSNTSNETETPTTSFKWSVGKDSPNKTVKQRESPSKCETKSLSCYQEKHILRKSSRKQICRNTCTLNCCSKEAETCCRKEVEPHCKNKLHETKNQPTSKHGGKVGQDIKEPKYKHNKTISARKRVIKNENNTVNLRMIICKEKLKVKMFGCAFRNRLTGRSRIKRIENGSSKKCKKTVFKNVNIYPSSEKRKTKTKNIETKRICDTSKISPLQKDTEQQFVRNLDNKFITPEKRTEMTDSSVKETKGNDDGLLTTPKKRWRDLFHRQFCSNENTSLDLNTTSSRKQTDKNIIDIDSPVTDLELVDIQDRLKTTTGLENEKDVSPSYEPTSCDPSSTWGSDNDSSCVSNIVDSGFDFNSTCARLIELSKIRNSSRTLPIFVQLK